MKVPLTFFFFLEGFSCICLMLRMQTVVLLNGLEVLNS